MAWRNLTRSLKESTRRLYRKTLGQVIPERLHYGLKGAACACLRTKREGNRLESPILPRTPDARLSLSGVVYTSIFNPDDGRKNWEDLLTGFLIALKNCEDATLVLKLIASGPRAVDKVWNFYRQTGIPHRCKVAFVPDFLSEEQLIELAGATTYYITTTRAEGNCLPLMNYLAAGRPGISPRHTAIADYFGRDVGFVVESHAEPAAFPHDSQPRKTTTWHRLVWTSLADEIRRSYEIVKNDFPAYEELARNARAKMLQWSSMQAVAPRLHAALRSVAQSFDKQASRKPSPPRAETA
jgi:hypothetical protein